MSFVLRYCRDKSVRAGRCTYRLVRCQFLLFFIGIVSLVIGLGIAWCAAKPIDKKGPSQYSIIQQTIAPNSAPGDHGAPEPHATIYFCFNQDDFHDTAEALKTLVAQVHEFDRFVVEVEGFTDCIGSEKLNNNLSRRRAESVAKCLRGRGVPACRIHTVGLGKDKRCGEGRPEDHRRVEVSVLKLPEPSSAPPPPR